MNVALELYNELFEVRDVSTQKDLDAVFKLRHQVYVVEREWIETDDHQYEKDEFDVHSAHSLLIYKPTGEAIGTARIVMPDAKSPKDSYPIQDICDHPMLEDQKAISCHSELSRFAISKEMREKVLSSKVFNETAERFGMSRKEAVTSVVSNMCIGLISGAIKACLSRGYAGLFAVLEPSLLRLLSRMGISGKNLGDVVNYHGKRQPCVFDKDFFNFGEDAHPLMKGIVAPSDVNAIQELEVTHNYV